MLDWVMWIVGFILLTSFGVAGLAIIYIIFVFYQYDLKQTRKEKNNANSRKL